MTMFFVSLNRLTRKRPRRSTNMLSRWFANGPLATRMQSQERQNRSERATEAEQGNDDDGGADYASVKSIDTLAQAYDEPDIKIQLLPSGDGAIVSIIPPAQPHPGVIASGHVPVDIVLVIDVSGSMNDAAPAPQAAGSLTGTKEDFGLSVLDLTKHAALTIMETLNEDDRLSIVTFSTRATVLQPLTHMTTEAKVSTKQEIVGMQPEATTNMWQGIMYGLDQFNDETTDCGRVPAIMVLTDGMPNFGDPPRGYVAKLRDLAPLPATIHTFGFGYQLDACLLKAVAEVGGGNFSFIPDSGMIGTVFIHAVAHLQSTHATKCTLEIKTPLSVKMATAHGSTINGTILDKDSAYTRDQYSILRLNLGNLQYGQSRDIYLECRSRTNSRWTFDQAVTAERNLDSNFNTNTVVLSAKLSYSFMRTNVHTVSREKSLAQSTTIYGYENLSPALVAYHQSRAMLCKFLTSFFGPDAHSGYTLDWKSRDLQQVNDRLSKVLDNLPARHLLNDASSSTQPILTDDEETLLTSLLLDLEGQTTMALSNQAYFSRWAIPYFASLSHAHSRQLCNTFKDPGPMKYNDNDFFRQCRDKLDQAFEGIEPPVPSRPLDAQSINSGAFKVNSFRAAGQTSPPVYSPATDWLNSSTPPPSYTSSRPVVNMSLYNDCNAGCFAAETLVQLAPSKTGTADERAEKVPISAIRAGVRVLTPLGSREVKYILGTAVQDTLLCRVRGGSDVEDKGVLATPWHPICISSKLPELSTLSATDGDTDSLHHAPPVIRWTFPAYLAAGQDDERAPAASEADEESSVAVRYTGWVYTLMLEPDRDPAAHAILLSSNSSAGGYAGDKQIWGVTLGHGLTSPAIPPALTHNDAGQHGHLVDDVRAHAFFGSYSAVEKEFLHLLEAEETSGATPTASSEGLVSCSGMRRDATTGLVTGFKAL